MPMLHKQFVMGSIAVLAPLLSSQANAATHVSASASASPNVSITDNICLSDSDKKFGYIAGLTPSANISAKNRSTALNVTGSVNLNSLTNSALKSKGCDGDYSERSQFNPQLNANFQTTLIDNFMKLAATGRVVDNEISSGSFGNSDEFDRRGSSNTLYRFRVTPSVTRRFGNVTTNTSYSFDDVRNSNPLAVDNVRHSANMRIGFGAKSAFTRSITGRYSLVKYDENISGVSRADSELSSVRLGLGYRFGRTLSVSGSIGEEWNSFQTNSLLSQDDNAWNFSVNWTPSPRTSLSVGLGDRFFGKTPTINFSHSGKRSSLGLQYRRQLRFRTDLDIDNFFDLLDDFDNFANPSIFTSTPIIDERVALAWSYTGMGSIIRLSGDYSEQTNTDNDVTSVFKDVHISYRPRSQSQFNVSASLGWRDDDPIDSFQRAVVIPANVESSESWYFNVNGTRSFSNRTTLSMAYRFSLRESDSQSNGYEENRITLSLSFHL